MKFNILQFKTLCSFLMTFISRETFLISFSLTYIQDLSKLSAILEDTENWLYEEGEDQPKQIYVDKLQELKVKF